MSRVDCRNAEKIENILFEDEKIKILNEDYIIELKDIPKLEFENKIIYYMQVGTGIYIIVKFKNIYINKIYLIEQQIINNSLSIKDIYTTTIVEKDNPLERFYKYDLDYEKENIEKNLIEIIEKIPVIFEKELLIEKINDFMSKEKIEKSDDLKISNNDLVETKVLLDDRLRRRGTPVPIIYENKQYNSLSELSRELNIPKTTLAHKLNKNRSLSEASGRRNIPVEYNGTIYPSQTQFLKEFNIAHGTFNLKIKQGMPIDEIVKRYSKKYKDVKGGRNGYKDQKSEVELIYNGKKYDSQKELVEEFNINQSTLSINLRKGMPLDEIVEKYSRLEKKDSNEKTFIYLGQEMTIRELAELSGINIEIIRGRIEDLGWSVSKAVETPVRKGGE